MVTANPVGDFGNMPASSWLQKLKNIFTVNPNWSTSILPPNSFRVPSPGSHFNYEGFPPNPESFTSGYAYFKRDHRRSFSPTVAVTQNSISGLLAIAESAQSSSLKAAEPAVPGRKREYRKANDQPPSDGYFPIINCE